MKHYRSQHAEDILIRNVNKHASKLITSEYGSLFLGEFIPKYPPTWFLQKKLNGALVLQLATHEFANYVLRVLVKQHSMACEDFIECLSNLGQDAIFQVCNNEYGNFFMQEVMKYNEGQVAERKLIHHVIRHTSKSMMSEFGSPFLDAFIPKFPETCPQITKQILDSKSDMAELANHIYAHHVLVGLIENCLESREQIIRQLVLFPNGNVSIKYTKNY